MGSIRLVAARLDKIDGTEVDLGGAQLNDASFTNATLNGASLRAGAVASRQPARGCR